MDWLSTIKLKHFKQELISKPNMDFIKVTEQASLYDNLENKSTLEILSEINIEDQKIALAVEKTIPAIVRNFTDEEMMEIAVLENLQRENLNVVDEANAYKTLMTNLNLTQEQVSKRVNKSRSHITNILGILTLPEDVKKQIAENKITMGHARVLSKLDNPKRIKELAKLIVQKNLSVRQIENLAKEEEKTITQKRQEKSALDLNIS